MLQTTNQLLEYSVISAYLMNNINYLVVAGLLSYNIPQVFKLKTESGYLIRSGLMVLMSMAIVPTAMLMPSGYAMGGKLLEWGACFIGGIGFATYGARKLKAKLGGWVSKFAVKSSVRKGSKTDIRYMDKLLNKILSYNPLKYINLKKGIFIGLEANQKPIYMRMKEWCSRHFLIVGATRSGKGVIMQVLGVQSIRLGETMVFLDPKGDKYMPHIFRSECENQGRPYHYINLKADVPQINLVADFEKHDLKNCFIEAFSQRESGNPSDVYRKTEQEFLENFAEFIDQQPTNGNVKNLKQLCLDYDINRYADMCKSSISDLNKLVNLKSINSTTGKSLAKLIDGGGCIYIQGDGSDETMKKIQRFIFCRVVQLARNYSDANNERTITVFADELVSHICKFVAESYTVTIGWGLKIVSAIQDLKLLRGAPADLDPEFLKGAVIGNSQNKLFYRCDDTDTANYLSDMTGKIQIEEEQKLVTRNSLNSEQLDRQTRLVSAERNYIDFNTIISLKEFEAVLCASLPNQDAIASLCKTSPVPLLPDHPYGKELTEASFTQAVYYSTIKPSITTANTNKLTNQAIANSSVSADHENIDNLQLTNGEEHASEPQSIDTGATSSNQNQATSTKKSDGVL